MSTNALNKPVSQVAHGFAVGEIVKFAGGVYALAQADSFSNANAIGMVSAINDVDSFWVTQTGYVVDLTTGPYVQNTTYFLSEAVAGALTSTAPTGATEYVRPIFHADSTTSGFVYTATAELGGGLVQYIDLGSEVLQTAFNAMIGMIDVFPSTDVTSDGATITLTYEQDGGGDVVAYFDGGPVTIDCTPALTIALTAGTDAVPVKNYVYILKSAPTILTKSTVGFPTTVEFVPVGTYICQTAGTVQTFGTLASHSYSDDLWKDTTQNGMVHYLAAWIRTQPATWESGVALTPTLTALGPDTLTLALAVGVVLQLHEHTFPAFDTAGGGSTNLNTFFVVNDNAAAYTQGSDLFNFKSTAAGAAAANNSRISWVVWASISEASGDCKMFINLPDGFYTSDADAIADAERFTNYSIPDAYKGAAFLVGKLTYQYQTGGGGSLTLVEQVDLRGSFPSTVAGGTGISGASVHLDNLTSVAINTGLAPDTDGAYDLGTDPLRWNTLYVDDVDITFPVAHEFGGLEEDVSAYDGYILISGGTTSNIKMNWAAAVAPGVTDDSASGYAIGSRWIDTTADNEYVCLDSTATAAVWKITT